MLPLLVAILAAPIHLTEAPNYCLDLKSNAVGSGSTIQLWPCNGSAAQDWTVGTSSATAAAPAASSAAASVLMTDAATPKKDGYTLIFSDEFDGTSLNLSKWNLEVDGSGGGNNELEYYVPFPANHFLANSALTLRVIKQAFLGQQYTSAKVTTRGTMDFTYGWVEARIKIPKGQGLWPAFWMLPKDFLYGTWPVSGELDIMEILGGAPNKLYGTAHFGPAWPNQLQLGGTQTASAGTDFSQDFHTYAVDWQPDHIDWYLDGTKYFTMTTSDGKWQTDNLGAVASPNWPFNIPNYLILNMAMGGSWPGAPDATITQADLVVDWVRVYSKD